MATLVLTAAGSLLGPIGGAVGALIGQAIDARIFKSKGRSGPRLQDLKVQTSSYGAPIPKLFGTLRVAGTLIWATDLVEHRSKQGGKGRPSTTTYSYTASFAVLLSGRPIRSVGRIWADGNLLRGAAGDWKSETGFRLHPGGEDQVADPFIASAEGADGTPAYRGGAYAVFEHMALGPFGNRIPSLTFEVEADAGAVSVGAMLDELSNGALAGEGMALRGFAASGESVSALVETLGGALPIVLQDDGARLRMTSDDTPLMLEAGEIAEGGSEAFAAAADVPEVLALGYYEPARDWQAGVQQARRPGGRRTMQVELPAALAANEAQAIAEGALARMAHERGQREVRTGWKQLAAVPGTTVRLPDDPGLWRVAGRTVERDGVRLALRRMRIESLTLPEAEPGRGVSAPDRVHGPTVVHLLDLPVLGDTALDVPRLHVAAAGSSPGWRRASLLISLDDGSSWTAIGATAAAAVIGEAVTVLGNAGDALIDTAHAVEIELLHETMTLEDADEPRLLAGANLALLGDELVQFGSAEPLGGARWRLSRLTRGRRGTGWAAGSHTAGERFVLIEAEALIAYDPPLDLLGGTVRVMASGIGDAVPAETNAASIGSTLRPPAPVHLSARRRSDGLFDISWIRCSRAGWAWIDGSDAPLAENREAYRLTVTPDVGPERTFELETPAFYYDPAADAGAATVTFSVVQIGTRLVSRPVALMLSL